MDHRPRDPARSASSVSDQPRDSRSMRILALIR
jgi:hypothetical protein